MTQKKTDEQKELEGTLRADRADSDKQLTVRQPQKPSYLSKPQTTIWDKLAAEFDFDLIDLAMFEAAVIQIDRARQARKILNEDGLEIVINNGATRVAHPMVKVEMQAQDKALKYLAELRKRTKPKEESKKPASPRAQALQDA